MTTNIDRAADIIDRLRLDSGPGDMSTAEHIARALADEGRLMPDLPEPHTFPSGEKEWYTPDGFVNLDTDGTITVVYDERDEDDIAAGAEIDPGELVFTRLSEAKVLARAFLAATNHAEKENKHE